MRAGRPGTAPAATAGPQPGPHPAGWAGAGFSRPGPAPRPAPGRELYRAALEDALAYTTDRDGCADCDGTALCESHAARAARAGLYQRALEQELEAGS